MSTEKLIPNVSLRAHGPVSHSAIWRRAIARWKPGLRVAVSSAKGQ